jgi:hypothetical protein
MLKKKRVPARKKEIPVVRRFLFLKASSSARDTFPPAVLLPEEFS